MAITFGGEGDVDAICSSSNSDENITSSNWFICGWFKHSANDGIVFSRATNYQDPPNNPGFHLISSFTGRIDLLFQTGTELGRIYGSNTGDNTWHHIVWCGMSGTPYMYLDGASDTCNCSGQTTYQPGTPTTISCTGYRNIGGSGWYAWAGSMHDFRVYNNPSWISNHANVQQIIYESRGNDCITDGLVTHIKANHGQNGVALSNGVGSPNIVESRLHYTSVTNTPLWEDAPIGG